MASWLKISDIRQAISTRHNREQIYCSSEYWDSKAEILEGDAVSMWPNNHLNKLYHQEQATLFNRYLSQVEGLDILDVGCGTGRISRHLATHGANVTGIDFSQKAIDLARSHTFSNNISYRVQSMFDLNDVDKYDILVSWGSVTVACRSKDELVEALSRFHQALKPDGKILLLEPIHEGFLHRVLNMNVQEFCQVMEKVGFQVKEIRHLHFWPIRLLLGYFPMPKLITQIGYTIGNRIMNLTGYYKFGDYRAIYAVLQR
jgi:2-polyprenyl-3-methyl-5-hydroxy-6-metoxy-1,4-benzoquinol methylase